MKMDLFVKHRLKSIYSHSICKDNLLKKINLAKPRLSFSIFTWIRIPEIDKQFINLIVGG
jgi:hypothetical protein